jgi:hypothetical protein
LPSLSSTAVGSGEIGEFFVDLSCSFLFLLGDSPPSSFSPDLAVFLLLVLPLWI